MEKTGGNVKNAEIHYNETMRTERLALGETEIIGFSLGSLRVDGGAMFGIVPKIVWEKTCPPDPENRVALSINAFLIRTPEVLILAETGIGSRLPRRYLDAYGLDGSFDLDEALAELGVSEKDVDIVFNSHLHFDHCGGNTKKTSEGSVVPSFSRARYIVQKGEWRDAFAPTDRDRPNYIAAHLRPLEKTGRIDLVDGNGTIAAGVEARLLPGHTAFHQGLKVSTGGKTFFYSGDLIPTAAHVPLTAVMSYDLFPATSQETKKKFCFDACREEWVLGLGHDAGKFFGKVVKSGAGCEWEDIEREPVRTGSK